MTSVASLVFRGARTLTFATIIMSLYYLFYYTGEHFLFSSKTIEDFRLNGKPFLQLSLAVVQILILLYLEIKVRSFSKQGQTILEDDYWQDYYDEYTGWEPEHDPSKQSEVKSLERTFKIFNLKPGSYYSRRINLYFPHPDDAWYVRIIRIETVAIFLIPISQIAIYFAYILEYAYGFNIPVNGKVFDHLNALVNYTESLWKVPRFAIFACLVELLSASYIYVKLFGIPGTSK